MLKRFNTLYYRIFSLNFNRIEVSEENAVVWDASIVLARYLIQQCQKYPDFLKGKNVLEIGSGLGLCGMTAAVLGAKLVLMTDLKDAVPLLEYNVEQNKGKFDKTTNIQVLEFTWSKEEAEKLMQDKTYDYVLMSDCIYYEESLEPLIDTLNVLTDSKKSIILLAQELRESQRQIDLFKTFIKKTRDKIMFREVPAAEQDPDYQCEEIMLYRCISK